MNDAGEFDYAKNVIYEALNDIGQHHNLPPIAQSLRIYTRKNLDHLLKDTSEISRAYCACLTVSPDDPALWETYAEGGKGFAIGFHLHRFLDSQIPNVSRGDRFVVCAPVTYDVDEQHNIVRCLVKAGIFDLQNFAATCSQQAAHLAALRDRITREIVIHILCLIDYIKAPAFNSEREMRLILDPNDSTFTATNVQHYEQDNDSIPFIFMDLRIPNTRHLPLSEIKVGPKSSFLDEKSFLENLLDELGYGSDYSKRPQITQSITTTNNRL